MYQRDLLEEGVGFRQDSQSSIKAALLTDNKVERKEGYERIDSNLILLFLVVCSHIGYEMNLGKPWFDKSIL